MSCENITYESENNIYEFKNILIQHNGELQKLIKELELTKIRRLEDLTQDIKAETVVHNTEEKLSTTKKELDHLVDLTHADLKSMGITRCSDRKAVLREAKKMNESFLNKQKTIDLC